jgi:hypothetical protein
MPVSQTFSYQVLKIPSGKLLLNSRIQFNITEKPFLGHCNLNAGSNSGNDESGT